MQGIYSITNRENGRQYIGSAIDIQRRWDWHVSRLNNGKHDNEHLQRAWKKYGQGVFVFAVVEHVSDAALLGSREDAHLRGLAPDCAYNICREIGRPPASKGRTYGPVVRANMAAAHRGRKHSAETRAKMSASWKPRHTPESLAKSSAKQLGRKLTLSPERRAQIAETNRRTWLGRKHSEARAKMSAAGKGRTKSLEHRAKISAAMIGNRNKVDRSSGVVY
jgi:group I intron endonuclease